MAYKNYKIRDNWLDIDKYNDVDIQSVDGVIQTVKVNGEDVGGGGSSDFSTAEVTIASEDFTIIENLMSFAAVDGIDSGIIVFTDPDIGTYTVPLYKGIAVWLYMGAHQVACTGNITYDPLIGIQIAGDGTITISAGE